MFALQNFFTLFDPLPYLSPSLVGHFEMFAYLLICSEEVAVITNYYYKYTNNRRNNRSSYPEDQGSTISLEEHETRPPNELKWHNWDAYSL